MSKLKIVWEARAWIWKREVIFDFENWFEKENKNENLFNKCLKLIQKYRRYLLLVSKKGSFFWKREFDSFPCKVLLSKHQVTRNLRYCTSKFKISQQWSAKTKRYTRWQKAATTVSYFTLILMNFHQKLSVWL